MKKVKILINTLFLVVGASVVACNSGSGSSNGGGGGGSPVWGSITQSNIKPLITNGKTVDLTYTLNGASNINKVTITATPSNASVFTSPLSCTITPSSSNTCTITATASAESSGGVSFTSNVTATTPDNGQSNYSIAAPTESTVVVVAAGAKFLFVSESSPRGDMGASQWGLTGSSGIANADTICQTNAANNKYIDMSKYGLQNATWKAMLVDGVSRSVNSSESLGWVFDANTAYVDIGSFKYIGTTNANESFDFPLANVWGNGGIYNGWKSYSNRLFTWTGLNSDWTVNSNICSSWTSSSSGAGEVGMPMNGGYNTDALSIYGGVNLCGGTDTPGSALRLVCVQQ